MIQGSLPRRELQRHRFLALLAAENTDLEGTRYSYDPITAETLTRILLCPLLINGAPSGVVVADRGSRVSVLDEDTDVTYWSGPAEPGFTRRFAAKFWLDSSVAPKEESR